ARRTVTEEHTRGRVDKRTLFQVVHVQACVPNLVSDRKPLTHFRVEGVDTDGQRTVVVPDDGARDVVSEVLKNNLIPELTSDARNIDGWLRDFEGRQDFGRTILDLLTSKNAHARARFERTLDTNSAPSATTPSIAVTPFSSVAGTRSTGSHPRMPASSTT